MVAHITLVNVADIEMLLKHHSPIGRHPHGPNAVPLSVDLHQEVSLAKKRARSRPNLVDVLNRATNVPLSNPTLSIIRRDYEGEGAFVAANKTDTVTFSAIILRLLMSRPLCTLARKAVPLPHEDLDAFSTLTEDPSVTANGLTPNIVNLLDFLV
jgi:hypothetical protein